MGPGNVPPHVRGHHQRGGGAMGIMGVVGWGQSHQVNVPGKWATRMCVCVGCGLGSPPNGLEGWEGSVGCVAGWGGGGPTGNCVPLTQT